MAIVVRTDLKMGKGKIAGQAAHAAVRATKKSGMIDRYLWFKQGETKIVLKVKSEDELKAIIKDCGQRKLNFALVHDAGRTQIEAGTLTAIGIGPHNDERIDKVIKDLKLL